MLERLTKQMAKAKNQRKAKERERKKSWGTAFLLWCHHPEMKGEDDDEVLKQLTKQKDKVRKRKTNSKEGKKIENKEKERNDKEKAGAKKEKTMEGKFFVPPSTLPFFRKESKRTRARKSDR